MLVVGTPKQLGECIALGNLAFSRLNYALVVFAANKRYGRCVYVQLGQQLVEVRDAAGFELCLRTAHALGHAEGLQFFATVFASPDTQASALTRPGFQS